ncbi:efflux transporter outer membrane subunit [Achromobacter spanius]|uniref:efflux transporter outer membrane subunit n=1 Tax=Achromobacter spanius TaxID=217203 RepID=UPI0036EDB663
MTPKLPLLMLTMVLSGCSLVPTYQRPEAPVPAAYPEGSAYAAPAQGTVAQLNWETFFHDAGLRRVVHVALANNRDMQKAALNVAAYRARYRISGAALVPEVEVQATGGRARTPADMSASGEQSTAGSNTLQVGIVNYEIDLWGRLRSLNQSALSAYLSTEEAKRGVQISLIADVAAAYLTWRTDQQLLDITSSTLQNYEHNLELVKASSMAGTASDLDVRQARTLVLSARGQAQAYVRRIAQDENALRLLLGAQVPANLPSADLFGQVLSQVPTGLPSDLLQQRPDIRAAEHNLMAANANIGAARAAFFPSITLTGGAGVASTNLGHLFGSGSESWSFVPQIHIPIFNGGRLKASLDYAEIQKEIGVASYEQAVQAAFREVADGLAAMGTWGEQLQSQHELVTTSQEVSHMAQLRYDEGVDSYLVLLDAQRQLLAARQKLASDRLAQLVAQIQLFKALGGGWS